MDKKKGFCREHSCFIFAGLFSVLAALACYLFFTGGGDTRGDKDYRTLAESGVSLRGTVVSLRPHKENTKPGKNNISNGYLAELIYPDNAGREREIIEILPLDAGNYLKPGGTIEILYRPANRYVKAASAFHPKLRKWRDAPASHEGEYV